MSAQIVTCHPICQYAVSAFPALHDMIHMLFHYDLVRFYWQCCARLSVNLIPFAVLTWETLFARTRVSLTWHSLFFRQSFADVPFQCFWHRAILCSILEIGSLAQRVKRGRIRINIACHFVICKKKGLSRSLWSEFRWKLRHSITWDADDLFLFICCFTSSFQSTFSAI